MNKIKAILLVLLLSQNTLFSQIIDLGSLTNFLYFTSAGAVENTGASIVTGDIGSDFGIITLPGGIIHNGNVQVQNTITDQASIDLATLYEQLMCVRNTDSTHGPTFGSGEILFPGVYSLNNAGTLSAALTLDGNGDTNALFIIKFLGAFNAAEASTVFLQNGTRACNVFWISEGAAALGAETIMVGNVISHNGATAMGANGSLNGRLLTMGGAIAFGPYTAQRPNCSSSIIAPFCARDSLFCGSIKPKSCASFTIFTSVGTIENDSISNITGNIGTNNGTITGFGIPSTVNGDFHISDSISAVTKKDLNTLYSQLRGAQVTDTLVSPIGGGDTLTPGVYAINSAGTVSDSLILNGLGDSNAIFIFKVVEDFSAEAASSISLINGIRDCNVYWVSQGDITLGDTSSMIGTFISKRGDIDMMAGAKLKGRIMTRGGSISVDNIESIALPDCGCFQPYPLPINLLSFKGKCLANQIRLNWETASETNNDYFSIERSDDGINWTEIGIINGAGNSSSTRKYFLDVENQYNEISYYRLKQHDFSGVARTFSPISVKNCIDGNDALSIYPNPAENAINILFNGEVEQVINTTIVDLFGRNVYQSSKYQSVINIENFEDGIYLLQLMLKSGNITRKFVVSK